MKKLLLSAFVLLQVADVLTTNRFLANGHGIESNPVMAFLQADFGALWWLPKLAVGFGCAAVLSLGRTRYAAFMVALYATTVVNNAML